MLYGFSDSHYGFSVEKYNIYNKYYSIYVRFSFMGGAIILNSIYYHLQLSSCGLKSVTQ